MTPVLVTALLAGVGLVLLLTAQPVGRPRLPLAERLRRLHPTQPPAAQPQAVRLFATPGLDRILLPTLQTAGTSILRLTTRLGVDPTRRARHLALVGDRGGLAVHYGSQLLLGLLGFGLLPLLDTFGLGGWPVWAWLATGAAGAAMPEVSLHLRVRRHHQVLIGQVAAASDYLALAVTAGLGLEQALAETAQASSGRLFDQLRTRLAHARLARQPGPQAVRTLAGDLDLPELEALAGVLEASSRYGTPIGDGVRAHAAAIRERRRLQLLAAGQQAQVTMLFPVTLFILPALLLLLLYPLAANLLQLTGP